MQSIRRLYVAKKGVFADEAKRLLTDLQENLLIKGLTDIHIFPVSYTHLTLPTK